MKKIRVLIADDHAMMLEGLKEVFNKEPDIEVVGEAYDGSQAFQMAKRLKPDVMCLDISMPVINGLDVIQMVRPVLPETRIVVVTMFSKEPYIRQALECGAMGYVLKSSLSYELIQAVRKAHRGEYCLSTKISGMVIQSYLSKKDDKAPAVSNTFDLLSEREKQVFRMLVKGQGTKTIADVLNISPKTVAKHRTNIMEKLGIDDLVALVKFALKHEVIDVYELTEE